jgi:hypothetical protein
MKLRLLFSLIGALIATAALAADFELAGMKSKLPDGWKEEEPSSKMRQAQFRLPKAEGDNEDGELAVFFFPGKGSSGTPEQNLKRQVDKFEPGEGEKEVKSKVEKIKVGEFEAAYQDVSGTFKKRAFPMAKDYKAMPGYRQLYVLFGNDKGDYYMTLLGPAKTVEKHKKEFESFLKNFK